MGGRRARHVHNRKVILATNKTPNRKFSALTVAAAGCAVAVAAIASGAATTDPTSASATGPAAAAEPHRGAVLDAFTRPLTAAYSVGALEHLWRAVGGSGGTATHAACIAEHESGGNPNAISRTNDWGLWQIHNGGPRMLNPAANAATAVRMSGNGRNWSAWTTARFC
jgi:soluble lytic murein transglycosylase-like protein